MDQVSFEDFTKLDIRVGRVVKAEPIEQADKLLKLTVDIGKETRVAVAGIAKTHDPQEVEGERVTMLVNLTPKKLMGVESQGMVLMAEDDKGNLCFIRPAEDMPVGTPVK